MLAIANLENNPIKKSNMLSYLSQLHHDMVNFGYQVIADVNGIIRSLSPQRGTDQLDGSRRYKHTQKAIYTERIISK